MKRLCVYVTYDKQNIVDRYIGYMLKELRTCVDYLAVVCNQLKVVHGIEILEKYADVIFFRENKGFDTGGFKDTLCSLVGWDKILQYDELVLVNDSMYGPFKSMRLIFDEMQEKAVDFWGIAKHGEGKNNEIDYFPEHIQTYFLVISSKMLHCTDFREYWEGMPYYTTYAENVKQYETKFTQYFSDLGFLYDTLADTDINDSACMENNYTQFGMIAYELIKKRNFPFLKKQQIVHNTLHQQTQENLRLSIDYIDKMTDYDVELIWENIIRSFNIADLQRSLHLQYIITESEKRNLSKNVMILILISHKKSSELVLEYLTNISPMYPMRIWAEKKEYLEDYQKHGITCEIIRGDKLGSQLADCSGFDLVCVLCDNDITSDKQPSYIGKSYFYSIWENLIKNRSYVSGVIEQFEKEPRLGFLAPPQPNFSHYFGWYGEEWNGKFEIVNKITKNLCLNCHISEYRPPFRIADTFWIRGCILKKLNKLKTEDYPYLPYLWSYFVQDAGYYAGIIESLEYASMNEVNLQHYLYQIAVCVKQEYGNFEYFFEMEQKIRLGTLRKFCEKYPKIFVYGVGEIAGQYKSLLKNAEAYIVSDGQEKPEKIYGKAVKFLSEVVIPDDYGIILCLNKNNQRQVIPLLEERGIKHYFCI